MVDLNKIVVEPLVQFSSDAQNFARKCKKPDRKGLTQASTMYSIHIAYKNSLFFSFCMLHKWNRMTSLSVLFYLLFVEFLTVARVIGVGFLIVGFIGFLVKLIHIPINNILVGGI